ncbi:MAG: Jag N-terminal domain-containing protein [Deltaproteobacteria bacterium]|nr:Jag N-terminal domain-containing protein [Deltaproteobacteria bacterium]
MAEEYREFEAKTVDEAIATAMRTFHLNFEQLDIQVISEGSKGLFGLVGTKTAKILARPVQEFDEDAPEPGVEEPPSSPAHDMEPEVRRNAPIPENAPEIISDLLTHMNMSSEIKIREDGVIEIIGDGSGIIIGKRGATLDALQFIVNRILNKDRSEPVYVTIDTEGYRQRHMDHLRSMAFKMGQKARRTGQSVSLERMNPYDRRIIHLALKNDSRVNTKSIGDGIFKKIVIIPRKASK